MIGAVSVSAFVVGMVGFIVYQHFRHHGIDEIEFEKKKRKRKKLKKPKKSKDEEKFEKDLQDEGSYEEDLSNGIHEEEERVQEDYQNIEDDIDAELDDLGDIQSMDQDFFKRITKLAKRCVQLGRDTRSLEENRSEARDAFEKLAEELSEQDVKKKIREHIADTKDIAKHNIDLFKSAKDALEAESEEIELLDDVIGDESLLESLHDERHRAKALRIIEEAQHIKQYITTQISLLKSLIDWEKEYQNELERVSEELVELEGICVSIGKAAELMGKELDKEQLSTELYAAHKPMGLFLSRSELLMDELLVICDDLYEIQHLLRGIMNDVHGLVYVHGEE